MGRVPLTRQEAVAALTASEAEIRKLGVARLALFGSVVRNQARPDSDVDVLVQFASAAKAYDFTPPFIGPRIFAAAEDVVRAA